MIPLHEALLHLKIPIFRPIAHVHCAIFMEMLQNSVVHMHNRPVSVNKQNGGFFRQFMEFIHIKQ